MSGAVGLSCGACVLHRCAKRRQDAACSAAHELPLSRAPPRPDPTRRAAVCVSYWANRLQPLPAGAPNLFVTLNPIHPPAGTCV